MTQTTVTSSLLLHQTFLSQEPQHNIKLVHVITINDKKSQVRRAQTNKRTHLEI